MRLTMGKETIISIIIVIAIIIGNVITQKYTTESISELSNKLAEVKSELDKEEKEIDENSAKNKIEELEEIWKSKHDKLAYYIEHDELEKVENDIIGLKSFVETSEYPEAISELDKSTFMLKHIEEKYKFSLENIF